MKTFKKISASLMVAVMVLTAAPLSGFVGMELNLDWLSFDWLDFNTKASAASYSGTCGESLTWSLDTSTYELVISGEGDMYYYDMDSGLVPWSDYRSNITKVTIDAGVTSIASSAFYYCTSLTSITIPDSVTSIRSEAFYNCTSLTSITIPDSVTSIGSYAFYSCTRLTSVTIPDGVTSIGDYAFYGCTGLTSVTIPDGVTSIGSYAFHNCTSLTSITIPDSVTSIGNSAFEDCTSLTSITISDSVTSIGSYAFDNTGYYNDSSNWEDDVLYIGNHLIKANTSISGAYTIKEGTMSIGPYAFRDCKSLTSITIPNSVTSIGYNAFYNCTSLTSITIPDSVTSIGSSAFSGCTSLTSITIPDSVTSIGISVFYNCTNLTSITIPDSVTSIGPYAFYKCTNLTSITIPDSVTSIGYYAFNGCNIEKVYYTGTKDEWNSIDRGSSIGLSTIVFECDSERPYYNCGKCGDNLDWILYVDDELVISGTGEMKDYPEKYVEGDWITTVPWSSYESSIRSVTIQNGVTSIGSYAFYKCTSLTSITIPDSVTSIGDFAFCNCSGIKELTMPISAKIYNSEYTFGRYANIEKITLTKGNGTAQNYGTSSSSSATDTYYGYTPWYISRSSLKELIIEDGVTGIGSYTFYGCHSLTSITIPDSVTSIGSYAFYGCWSLTSITIPDSVTSIGNSVFRECKSLTSITIPDGVTSIGDWAFGYCDSLTSITIPDSVTSIGSYAFYNCKSLTSVTIGNGVTSIGSSAFSGCTSLTSITIPDSVTSIGDYAFQNCSGLADVSIGDGVTSIGSEAFYNCTSLTSITIPDSVTSIGSYAFSNCTSLTSIAIGNNVTSIGTYAFRNCEKLEEVTFTGDSIVEFGEEIFYGSPKAMICCEENSWLHFYASSNGMRFCLLDDDKLPAFEIKNNVLVSYRGASENVSVSIVNQIGYGAFEGNSTVENIEIAKSVNVIYNNAFKNCSALKSVYIPQSVTSIGATAFNGCDDVTIWCYAGSYADEYAQTHDIDVEYITLSIDDSIIYLSPNEQTTVTYSLNTHLADNMSVVWESTDKTIVTVDSFGNIKGIKAGTAVVVVASKDGTMRDYCVVKVVGIEALSTLSIDFESGIISGLSSNTKSLDGLITMTDSSCNLSYTTLGTDSVVYVERDNEIVDAYTILIYGDVNGDSWYDGQDAIIVDCLANGMLTQNDVSEAVYTAADCNHDGVIDQLDVEILNQAGTLLSNVDQSKPAEVLLETSAEYVEYLDLIDQSPEIEVENETDAPEADVDDSEPIEENGIFTFIFDLVAILKNFFNFIFSFVNL